MRAQCCWGVARAHTSFRSDELVLEHFAWGETSGSWVSPPSASWNPCQGGNALAGRRLCPFRANKEQLVQLGILWRSCEHGAGLIQTSVGLWDPLKHATLNLQPCGHIGCPLTSAASSSGQLGMPALLARCRAGGLHGKTFLRGEGFH